MFFSGHLQDLHKLDMMNGKDIKSYWYCLGTIRHRTKGQHNCNYRNQEIVRQDTSNCLILSLVQYLYIIHIL